MSNVGLSMGSSGTSAPKPPKSKRRVGGVLIFVILLVAALLLGAAFVAWTFLKPAPDYSGQGSGTVVVTVSPGQSISSIGDELAAKGVVQSSAAFVAAASSDDRAKNIPTGSFELRNQMSAVAALDLLVDPDSRVVNKLTVKEGERVDEVVAEASKVTGIPVAEFTAALKSPKLGLPDYAKGNAEGFLYPATYEVEPKATATSILSMMVTKFNSVADSIQLESRAKAQGRSPYEIVTIASLLEAEGTPTDFGQIARVVENRLAKDMPLQFDSTINYATKSSNIQLSKDQLALDSPYNSYQNKGLPPTPIGQPSKAALEAALTPPPGNWLYFVTVDPDAKITKFTDNYQEFLTFVDELNSNLKSS